VKQATLMVEYNETLSGVESNFEMNLDFRSITVKSTQHSINP